jgi:hypothetical protein
LFLHRAVAPRCSLHTFFCKKLPHCVFNRSYRYGVNGHFDSARPWAKIDDFTGKLQPAPHAHHLNMQNPLYTPHAISSTITSYSGPLCCTQLPLWRLLSVLYPARCPA